MFIALGGCSSSGFKHQPPIVVGALCDLVTAVALLVISRTLIAQGKGCTGVRVLQWIGTLEALGPLLLICYLAKRTLCPNL